MNTQPVEIDEKITENNKEIDILNFYDDLSDYFNKYS